jgi:hypothetical protein
MTPIKLNNPTVTVIKETTKEESPNKQIKKHGNKNDQ